MFLLFGHYFQSGEGANYVQTYLYTSCHSTSIDQCFGMQPILRVTQHFGADSGRNFPANDSFDAGATQPDDGRDGHYDKGCNCGAAASRDDRAYQARCCRACLCGGAEPDACAAHRY